MNLMKDCWHKGHICHTRTQFSDAPVLKLATFLQCEAEDFAMHRSARERSQEGDKPRLNYNELSIPSVEFFLCYDAQRRTLLLFLQRICHLSAPGGSSIRAVLSDSSLTSRTVYQPFNPVYNEPLEFSGFSLPDVCECTLHLQVYTHREEFWSSGGEFIGSASLVLKDVDLYGTPLSRAIDSDSKEIVQINGARGEVLVTVGFGERMKSIHGNLQRARNLYVMDICGTSDPYANIYLFYKETMMAKWKSSIKMEKLDPIYNEPFYFDIEEKFLNDISLKITVMDYDKVGRNEVIGCALIGIASSCTSGRNQWKTMIQNPGVACSFWHTLSIT